MSSPGKPDKSKNKARARDFFDLAKSDGVPTVGSDEDPRRDKPRIPVGGASPRAGAPPAPIDDVFATEGEATPRSNTVPRLVVNEEPDDGTDKDTDPGRGADKDRHDGIAGEDTASDELYATPTSAIRGQHDAKAATTQQMDELDGSDAPLMDSIRADESPAGSIEALRALAADLGEPRRGTSVPVPDETVRSSSGPAREGKLVDDEDTRRSLLQGGSAPPRSSAETPFPRPTGGGSPAMKPPVAREHPPQHPPGAGGHLPQHSGGHSPQSAPLSPPARAEPPPQKPALSPPKKPSEGGAKKPDEARKPPPPPPPKKPAATAESKRGGAAKPGAPDLAAPDRGAATEIMEGAAELARFPGSGEGRIPLIVATAGLAVAGAGAALVDPLVRLPIAVVALGYVGVDQLLSVRLVARGDRVRGRAPRAAEAGSLFFTVIALWLSCFAPTFFAYAAVPSRPVNQATHAEDVARATESLAKLLVSQRGLSPDEASKQARAQLLASEDATAGRPRTDNTASSGGGLDRSLIEIGALVLGILGVAYLPMALLLTALRASPAASFGYVTGLGSIARFVTPYAACAGSFIAGAAALFGLDAALGTALRASGLPEVLAAAVRGAILGGTLAYFMSVGAYLVGRLFHRDGWQLGWGEVA